MKPAVIPDLLAPWAKKQPGVEALVSPDGNSLNYRQLLGTASRFARGLENLGMSEQARIGFRFEDEYCEHVVSYFGTLLARCIAVPLAARAPEAELSKQVAEARAQCVIQIAPRPLVSSLPTFSFDEVLARGDDQEPSRTRSPHDYADILFTSGSTGTPKAVLSTHENLMFSLRGNPESLRARPILHASPFHTMACNQVATLISIWAGATSVHLGHFDPRIFYQMVEKYSPSVVALTPTMARIICDFSSPLLPAIKSVTAILVYGDTSNPALLSRLSELFPQSQILNLYGVTESPSGIIATMPFDPSKPLAVGRPNPGVEVRIIDASGRALPPGTAGRILARCIGISPKRYVTEGHGTATHIAGGWVQTGDLGYLDSDGYLYVTDREKDVVMVGGESISCREVEDCLESHPSVREAAIFAVPDSLLGQHAEAAIVKRSSVGAEELQRFVAERASPSKVPRRIHFLSELPRGESGKVAKYRLREMLERKS